MPALDEHEPLVTIGVPGFNRPDGLKSCLASLRRQSFSRIAIVIADDCSPDRGVAAVMHDAAADDARIRCIFRPQNIGMFANFCSLLEHATTPYFMWSSNDDYWDRLSIATMVAMLEANPKAALACGGLRHFNHEGISDTVYSPVRFASTADKLADLRLFLEEPEILGKSHLLYGLYRTDALRKAVVSFDFGRHDRWSEDVMIAFSVLCRHDVVATDQVFLYKHTRWRLEFAPKRFADDFGVPKGRDDEYCNGLLAACIDDGQRELVRSVMARRRRYRNLVTRWRKPTMRLIDRLTGARTPRKR